MSSLAQLQTTAAEGPVLKMPPHFPRQSESSQDFFSPFRLIETNQSIVTTLSGEKNNFCNWSRTQGKPEKEQKKAFHEFQMNLVGKELPHHN